MAGGVKRPHGFYRGICRQRSSRSCPLGEGVAHACFFPFLPRVFPLTPKAADDPASSAVIAVAPITTWRGSSCGDQPTQHCTRKQPKERRPSSGLPGRALVNRGGINLQCLATAMCPSRTASPAATPLFEGKGGPRLAPWDRVSLRSGGGGEEGGLVRHQNEYANFMPRHMAMTRSI